MSGSWNEQRRVAAIRAAQRAEEAQRYLLEVRKLREESDDRPLMPEVELDTGWPERSEAPDAPPALRSVLRSSLRQTIAGESWDAEPTGTAVEPGASPGRPGSEPKSAPAPVGAPPHAAITGPAQSPDLPPTMSNEVGLAFDLGVQEMARPPAPLVVPPDDVPRGDDPVAAWGAPVDDALAPRRDPQRPEPLRPPVSQQRLAPVGAQPPAVPVTMPHEVAAVFEAGARELAAAPAPTPPRDPVPVAPQRSAAPAAAPKPNEVAAAFDASAREMASLQARLPRVPVPDQVEAPASSPSTPEPRQASRSPTSTPTEVATAFEAGAREMASPQARPPTVSAPDQVESSASSPSPSPSPSTPEPRQPPPSSQPHARPHPPEQQPWQPRDAAEAFDAGVRDMAPPSSLDQAGEPRSDPAEPDRDGAMDERQSAQLALDARLAQLTFRGILTHGGG